MGEGQNARDDEVLQIQMPVPLNPRACGLGFIGSISPSFGRSFGDPATRGTSQDSNRSFSVKPKHQS